MNKCLVTLACMALLAGCAEKTIDQMSYSERQELSEKLVQSCRDQGVRDGTPEMDACWDVEARREVTRREESVANARRFGEAVGESMQTYGESRGQMAASPYVYGNSRTSMSCTSSPMGYSVRTTCY